MRKLSKKISMLMVLAMLVGMFSGVVSASAASAWSFKSKNYEVAVDGTVVMGNKEYADFDLLKDGKAPTGYTVTWASSNEDVVWVNAKTGQLRANKLGMANIGDKAVISATFTNTATKKSATRSFVIAYGTPEYELVTKIGDVVLGEETLAVGESYKLATTVLDEAGNSVDFKTCELYRNYFIDGKAIENPFVPEKEGEVTIVVAAFTAKADMKDLSKAVQTEEFKVTAVTGDFSVEATGVKEITVFGDFAKDAKFTVKKAKTSIKVDAVKVAEDGKNAVLSLGNKLTKGTYTVTCGETTADITVEDEYVKSIIILDDGETVTLSGDRTKAYVYYDVINQYDESVRKNYSVAWTTSTASSANILDEKGIGRLTIPASVTDPTKTFTYGTAIVITGVHTAAGNAKHVNGTVFAGLENRVDRIEVLGVMEINVPKLTTLPAGFVNDDYMLVYKAYDQMGYEMDYSDADVANNLSFTTMTPMLIGAQFDKVAGGVVIDGVNYGAVQLERGINTFEGGIALIQVTSTVTGKSEAHELAISTEQTLASFSLLAPDFIIAEGDGTVEIPFEAYDQDGDPVKSFRVLHKSVSLNDTALKFIKKDDGTAKIEYSVPADAGASKNVDVPQVFTSTVIRTGSVSTLTLNIKDKAYPAVVKGFGSGVRAKGLEGDSWTIKVRTGNWWENDVVKYYDQYGREMGNAAANAALDGVNNAVALKVASGSAFTVTSDSPGTTYNSGSYVRVTNTFTLNAGREVTAAELADTIELVILNFNADKGVLEVASGSAKKEQVTAYDLTQCRSFSIEGDALIENTGVIKLDTDSYEKAYGVKGFLADGTKLPVPNFYVSNFVVDGGAATYVTNAWTPGNALKVTPNYTASTGQYSFIDHSGVDKDNNALHKTQKFTVKATVNTISGTGLSIAIKDTATLDVVVDDANEKIASFKTKGDNFVIAANGGNITYNDIIGKAIDKMVTNYADEMNPAGITVVVSKVAETKDGLYSSSNADLLDSSIVVAANNLTANDTMLTNAETGDTFEVTFSKDDANVTLKFTVGADSTAKFTNASQTVTWR